MVQIPHRNKINTIFFYRKGHGTINTRCVKHSGNQLTRFIPNLNHQIQIIAQGPCHSLAGERPGLARLERVIIHLFDPTQAPFNCYGKMRNQLGGIPPLVFNKRLPLSHHENPAYGRTVGVGHTPLNRASGHIGR